ncbi:hypothetical protein Tco_1168908, partial [Tanacetum coccineum]
TPTKVTQGEEQCQDSSEAQLSVLSAAKILADASREKVKTYTRRRSTDSSRHSIVGGLFSTVEEVQDTEVGKTKTKRIAEETLLQESFKKLRTTEASRLEPIQEQPTEEPKELSEEEFKKMIEIVPVE